MDNPRKSFALILAVVVTGFAIGFMPALAAPQKQKAIDPGICSYEFSSATEANCICPDTTASGGCVRTSDCAATLIIESSVGGGPCPPCPCVPAEVVQLCCCEYGLDLCSFDQLAGG